MQKLDLFQETDFREYIQKKLKTADFGHGGKSKLAQHLRCQPSFISQVLKGVNTLSLEQAFRVNEFLKHSELERAYFMTLVEADKAGTQELKQYYQQKLEEIRDKAKLIENRITHEEISESDTIKYFTNWNHVKIHHLANIPKYRKIKALQQKLNLPEEEFEGCLSFLLEINLLEQEGDELKLGLKKLHTRKNSPAVALAHVNARLQNLQNLKNPGVDSLNFGANLTISEKNYKLFRNKLVVLLEELYTLVEQDEPERMCSFVIDLMDS